MSSDQKPQDWQKYLPALLVAAAGFLLFLGLFGTEESGSGKNLKKSPKLQSQVNQHLQKTAEKIEMAKRQQALRSSQLVNDYRRSVSETAYEAPSEGVNLQEARMAESVANDLGRSAGAGLEGGRNASDLIHQQMFENQIAQQQDKAYRDEYARQFIENARRGGWDVTLDENYKVISVKRIKHAKKFDLFE